MHFHSLRSSAAPSGLLIRIQLGVVVAVAFAASCTPERVDAPTESHTAAEIQACDADADPGDASNACLTCHEGLEHIRCLDAPMMTEILAVAAASGSGNRCVVCHGGDPRVHWEGPLRPDDDAYKDATRRGHTGAPAYFADHPGPKAFYPDPGSPWINEHSCGPCHAWEVDAQWRSLMMTEAGKIQGTAWGFGGMTGYEHRWANYAVSDPDDPHAYLGTDAYKASLARIGALEPQVFVDRHDQVPAAPTDDAALRADPSLAAFTYIRGECQRCHLGVGGKQRYGDWRGMGCSACHMPYGNAGQYQGADETLDPSTEGRPLVHSMQGTRKAVVTVGDVTWTGIPVETCTTCHNRGRRIGVSFQGLMETPYASPWQPDGEPQQKLHGKHYMKLQEDLHARKGLLCQDCHTTLDAHSANKLIGAISGAVEVECTDCHGTPSAYPWELPLGWGDEYETRPMEGPARGTVETLPAFMEKGAPAAPADGYLLTARGNPFGNVVREGDHVRIHLASGASRLLTPLKGHVRAEALSTEGRVAMADIRGHIDGMECYTCHATWAPQCYGCHIKVDYSAPKMHLDWVAAGDAHDAAGLSAERAAGADAPRIPGAIQETRSFLRWEDPALGRNGEGRVSPVVPGCQTTATVIAEDGDTLLSNHAFRIPDVEGAGPEGQVGLDMSPLHPHTVQKGARSCASCHADPKALGYGIGGGRIADDLSQDHVVDLMTADGRVIPSGTTPQTHAMNGMSADWSRFVTEDGQQVQTVGHHFRLSGPLDDETRARMSREGVCTACHEVIPDGALPVSLLHHVADAVGMAPETDAEHSSLLMKITLLAAWVQVGGALVIALFGIGIIGFWWVRRRRRKSA